MSFGYASSEVTKSLSCREWKIRVVVGEKCCWRNKMSNDIVTNFYTNLFCTNWCDMIKLVKLNIYWPT